MSEQVKRQRMVSGIDPDDDIALWDVIMWLFEYDLRQAGPFYYAAIILKT